MDKAKYDTVLHHSNYYNKSVKGYRGVPMIIVALLLAGVVAYDKTAGLGFNTLDYVLLGVLFLSCLIGYIKGIIITLFNVIGYVAGVVLAKILSPSVANILIEKTGIDKKINDIVLNQFKGMNIPAFNSQDALNAAKMAEVDISGADMTSFSDINSVTSQFPEAKQVFEANPMFGNMFEQYGDMMGGAKEQFTGATLSFVEAAVYIIMLVLSAIAVFIVVKLIVAIFGRIINAIANSNSVLTSLNKWGGVVLGLFSGVLLLYVAINFIFPALSAFSVAIPLLDEINNSAICGMFN